MKRDVLIILVIVLALALVGIIQLSRPEPPPPPLPPPVNRPSPGRFYSVDLPGDVKLPMLWCPAATFMMGAPPGQAMQADEGPQTTVTLTGGFWLGQTEVTQEQWVAVMGTNPSKFASLGLDLPVEQVSWNDAAKFCAKLTQIEREAGRLPPNLAYALPTEAQWEYACHAGTTTLLPVDPGTTAALGDSAWFDANSGGQPHPVGQKLANPWGFYDMLGNVWEYCSDWYMDKLPGGSVVDPIGAPSGTMRANRGGGWWDIPQASRWANRGWMTPDDLYDRVGFRLALVSVEPTPPAPPVVSPPK